MEASAITPQTMNATSRTQRITNNFATNKTKTIIEMYRGY